MSPKRQPNKQPSIKNKTLQKKQNKQKKQIQEIVPIIMVSQLQKKYYTKFMKEVEQNKQKFENVSNIIRAKFKKDARISQRRKLINGKQDILVSNVWKINKAVRKEQQWINLIQMMEEIYCAKLTMRKFVHQRLLPTLSVPFYKNLHYLNLSWNKINNVQALSSLDAPNLTYIDLNRNDIKSVRSLIKLSTSKIRVLNLDQNHILTLNELGRIQLGKSKIQFGMQFYFKRNQNNALSIVDDIRFVSKIQRGKLKRSNSFKMFQAIRRYKKVQTNWLVNRAQYITFSNQVITSLLSKFQAKQADLLI